MRERFTVIEAAIVVFCCNFIHGGYRCEHLPRSIASGCGLMWINGGCGLMWINGGCEDARVSSGFVREEFSERVCGGLNTEKKISRVSF